MKTVAEKETYEFVLGVGDNFYSHGISTDAHDPRFKETFEDVYTGSHLDDLPFYFIAGNVED